MKTGQAVDGVIGDRRSSNSADSQHLNTSHASVGQRKSNNSKIPEARAAFISSLLYSVLLLAIAGIVTGVSYAFAKPGGTYLVTSGLFLFGGIYLCLAIYRLFQWVIYVLLRK